MSGVDEQIKLVSKILNGKIDKAGVEKEIEQIANKYGDDCFNSYTVKRKPKPWSVKDLQELEGLSTSGAASKEFYLYMAEVSEEVFSKEAFRKRIYIGGVIVLIVMIICIILFSSIKSV